MAHRDTPVRTRSTFCRICEAACGLQAEIDADSQLVRLRPDRRHPVSQGFACAKGTRFVEVATHPDRLFYPLRRNPDGRYERATWTDAMRLISEGIRPILDRYGPHAIGIYFGNPLAFHTMGALTMLGFMRALGTRNVFTAGSQDCNNKFAGAQILHGSPLIHPIPDLVHTDFALMLGTNPAVSQSSFVHLEGGSTVFDQLLRRGARVVWVDPRRTESAKRWGDHLPLRPGTDVFLLLALLVELRDLYQPDTRTEGLETLLALAAQYPVEYAAHLSGIEPDRIRDLAARLRQARRATFHMSVGVNQGPFGTLCYVALQALAHLTGNLDRQGGLLFHPLAVWLAKIGRHAGISRPQPSSRIGSCNNVLMSLPAGIMADEILTPGAERIRALIVVSGDPLNSVPGGDRLRDAVRKLDCLVAVDLFQNTTGREADVLLPTTSWVERWDVATTTVMLQQAPLIQYAGAIQPPPGEVRSETRILADVSRSIGRPLGHWRALAWLWGHAPWDAALTALSHLGSLPARLRFRGVQGLLAPTPKPGRYLGRGPRTPGHRIRFWHPDLEGERERLRAYTASLQTPRRQAGAPMELTLICRRRRLGHNSWLHGALHNGEAEDAAWLAPTDLADLGLPHGGKVRLQTASASLQIDAVPVDDVTSGVVVVPHGLPNANVNALIPSGVEMIEPLSGQHRLTGIPVRVSPVRLPSLT
jgi:formate dehydrogenase